MASGRLDSDYTFDGGVVWGVAIKNILGGAIKYLGSKIFGNASTKAVTKATTETVEQITAKSYTQHGSELIDDGFRMLEQPIMQATNEGLSSGQLGKIIGWGEGQTVEAIQQTINVSKNLTKFQVQEWAKQGLTKSWVQNQLTIYSKSLMKGGDKLKNTQLIHRKELMFKILELW